MTVTRTDPLTEVTYTYAATNTGNTPLGSVTLDDERPALRITHGADAPGNDDDVGETWTAYSCTAAPDDIERPVTNTATVERYR